jgi:hypothetical protein
MTVTAKVIGWTDSNDAELFEDEHGYQWKHAVDAADGTVAVERTDGLKAGIFSWHNFGMMGTLKPCEDGETYGVNCEADRVVVDGEWVEIGDEMEADWEERTRVSNI